MVSSQEFDFVRRIFTPVLNLKLQKCYPIIILCFSKIELADLSLIYINRNMNSMNKNLNRNRKINRKVVSL